MIVHYDPSWRYKFPSVFSLQSLHLLYLLVDHIERTHIGSYIMVKDFKPFSERISGICYIVSVGLLEAIILSL